MSDDHQTTTIDHKIQLLKDQPVYVQKSQEWLKQRSTRLTGCDFSAAIGKNKYKSSTQLLFDKCGAGEPFTGNEFTEWGEYYEDIAVKRFEEITGKTVLEFGLLQHPTIDWLGSSPDGVTTDGCVLEIKCPGPRKLVHGEIPECYIWQVVLNMEVCDLDEAYFMEYKPKELKEKWGGPLEEEEINLVHVKRDKKKFEDVLDLAREFWDSVLHYRKVGIENHPKYLQKLRRKNRKAEQEKCLDLREFMKKTDLNLQEESSDDDEVISTSPSVESPKNNNDCIRNFGEGLKLFLQEESSDDEDE